MPSAGDIITAPSVTRPTSPSAPPLKTWRDSSPTAPTASAPACPVCMDPLLRPLERKSHRAFYRSSSALSRTRPTTSDLLTSGDCFTFNVHMSENSGNGAHRRPTLRDVAREAHVSVQTVSNVVQGRHHLMRADTRERVQAAMAQLGYHPNVSARGLRSARTRTFGFLVLDEAPSFLADPLTDLLIAGVADVARDCDYEILRKAERPLARRRDLLRPLLE